jgi:hypothetical protein
MKIAAFLRRPDVQACLADGAVPLTVDIREQAREFYIILNETAKARVFANERAPKRLWLDEINRRMEPLQFLQDRSDRNDRRANITVDIIDPQAYGVDLSVGDFRVALAFCMRTLIYKQFDRCRTTVGDDGDVHTMLEVMDMDIRRMRRTIVDSIHLLFEIPYRRWEPEVFRRNAWLDGFSHAQREVAYSRTLADTSQEDPMKHAIGEGWRKAQADQIMQGFIREWVRQNGLEAIRKDAKSRIIGVTWATEIGRREMKPDDPRAVPMLWPVIGRNHRFNLSNTPLGLPSLLEESQLCFGVVPGPETWSHERIQEHIGATDFVPKLVDLMLRSPDAMSYEGTVSM